jgi:hypothetical protein
MRARASSPLSVRYRISTAGGDAGRRVAKRVSASRTIKGDHLALGIIITLHAIRKTRWLHRIR